MKNIHKELPSRNGFGKYSRLIAPFLLSLMSLTVSSCTAIAEIFKAGMGFGIFLVLAVLVIIVFIFMRLRKK
jgi:hypothetical protein